MPDTLASPNEHRADQRNWAPWFAAFAASALVLALRAPDSLDLPQFWAEDGAEFFAHQLHHGLPQLFLPYSGYLHLIPRLVAWVAAAFSALHAPAIYCYSALFIGAASIASLRELRLGLGGFAFILAPFALTPTNGEVFGTLTNAQWFTQFYLLVVVSRFVHGQAPANAWRAHSATILAGLSGPFCLFSCVAAAAGWLWAWRIERRHELSPKVLLRSPAAYGIGILLLCSIVQLWAIAQDAQTLHPTFTQWMYGVEKMFAGLQGHFFGRKLILDAVFLTAATAIVAASLIWIPRTGGERTTLVVILAFVLAGFLAATIKSLDPALVSTSIFAGDRYFLAPKVFLWWCIAVVIAAVWRRSVDTRFAVLAILLGASAVFANTLLQRQPLRDMDWNYYAEQIDHGDAVSVPINPDWRMKLPARDPQQTSR